MYKSANDTVDLLHNRCCSELINNDFFKWTSVILKNKKLASVETIVSEKCYMMIIKQLFFTAVAEKFT